MINFNTNQLIEIKKLNPLTDSKFMYDSSKWEDLKPDYKELIKEFENKYITRKDVIDAYSYYLKNNTHGIIKPILLTMVWGFSNTGYGNFRTNKYLNNDNNIAKFEKAIQLLQNNNDNLEESFEILKGINGLGISYLSKILYFATKACNIDDYALIFDIRVASAFVKIAVPKEIYGIIKIGPSSNFEDYQTYNQIIHNFANEHSVEAEQIEMYLFKQEFE
jgi:hypothetical protein